MRQLFHHLTAYPYLTNQRLGTGAAVAGAATVGAVAEALGAVRDTPLRGRLPLLGLIGGMAGALTDSVLGAMVQAISWCPAASSRRSSASTGAARLPLAG